MLPTSHAASIQTAFKTLKDPRVRNRSKQRLIERVAIARCGVIANCETWAEIVDFASSPRDWLQRFLKLPNGIPS